MIWKGSAHLVSSGRGVTLDGTFHQGGKWVWGGESEGFGYEAEIAH